MKKPIALCLLLASFIMLVAACSKNSDSSASALGGATVGGSAFNPTVDSAEYYKGDSTFLLTMTSGTGSIVLIVTHFKGTTGDYTTFFNSGASGLINSTGIHEISTGTLHISSISGTNVAGTFSFTTTDNISVTNGTFNCKLTVYDGGSGNNVNTGSLSAKINGIAWVGTFAESVKQTDSGTVFLTIAGVISSGSTVQSEIALSVVNFNGNTGAIAFDSTGGSTVYSYSDVTTTHIANTGVLNITSISTSNIQGTFNFSTADGFAITNGVFDTPLTIQ